MRGLMFNCNAVAVSSQLPTC